MEGDDGGSTAAYRASPPSLHRTASPRLRDARQSGLMRDHPLEFLNPLVIRSATATARARITGASKTGVAALKESIRSASAADLWSPSARRRQHDAGSTTSLGAMRTVLSRYRRAVRSPFGMRRRAKRPRGGGHFSRFE